MSGTNLERAAHVDHTIEHSHADLGNFIGLGLGIVAGIAIVATGGLAAAPLACGIAVLGGDIGEFVGGLFPNREDSGHIARGSPTVFYGPQIKPAARMNDRTACYSPGMPTMERATPWLAIISPVFAGMSLLCAARGINRAITISNLDADVPPLPSDNDPGAHAGSIIADGSQTVFIELWPAARDKDGVFPCDGKISSGIDTILIGGPRCRKRGTEERNEVDRGQRFTQKTIDVIGNLLDWKNPSAWISLASDFVGLFDERAAAVLSSVNLFRSVRGIGKASELPGQLARIDKGSSVAGIVKGFWGTPKNVGTLFGPPADTPNSFDPVTGRVGPPIYPRRLGS